MTAPAGAGFARVRSVRERWLATRALCAAWGPAGLLLAAVLLGLFFDLGGFPLFDVDEGAFGEATREMLARGDYVSTWLDGRPRFDKPILTYWLQAWSVALLGPSELALRLPSALAACAWIGAILAFGLRFLDRRAGYTAAFIAATTLGVVVIGRGAIADALLNLFLALAMFDLYRVLAGVDTGTGAQKDRAARRRVFLWIGLGVLTKGPVALLVPGAVGALAFGLHGQLARWWRAARDPVGWLILLGVALPWYALETWRRGDAFLTGFFLRHNVERFLEPLQGHGGSVLYYLPAVLLLLLPYTGLFLATLPSVRRLRAGPLDTFLWCWFLFVLGFFSLAATKLPHYLLYGVTPLFLLMARTAGAADAVPRPLPGAGGRPVGQPFLRPLFVAFLPALTFLAALAGLPMLLQRFAPGIRNPYLREALYRPEAFGGAWEAVAVALLLLVGLLACWRRAPLWPRVAASALACSFALGGLLLPTLAELQQGPVKEAARLARQHGWAVRSWRINVPSFSFYRGAVTPAAEPPGRGDVILTRVDALAALGRSADGAVVLYRKGGIVLLRMPA
jgi:4-amino-4-deoxy-L-arabinose transferase-like glycosyltransferase